MSECPSFGSARRAITNVVNSAEAREKTGDLMQGLFGVKLRPADCEAPQLGIGLGKLPQSLS
jgi:hypothetical protein